MKHISALATLLTACSLTSAATLSEPQPLALPPGIDAPRDVRYPGTMTLHVDATDTARRIYRFKQTIPVEQGPMTLLYARWIPGTHAPVGPVHNLAGLRISAGGKSIPWTRDSIDVYAYRIDVPNGVDNIDIEAQLVTPTETAQGAVVITAEMLRLNWYATALYPAGHFARRIDVDASVTLPAGWQYGVALETQSASDGVVRFKTVSFETLVDSPLIAGKHFKQVPLDARLVNGRSRVMLNMMADEPDWLNATPTQINLLSEMVRQADKLFGARHFDHYDFLLWLSDRMSGAGLEHQRSSENGVAPRYFTGWDTAFVSRDLLAHEYVHSWNGKYRRPADLWTPNYNVPMRDSLLWVYEGQTQYWGNVLTARAGLLTKQQALDELANTAAQYEAQTGRSWRPLQDTTHDPIIANRRPIPWRDWQRSEDYYREGGLLWLEIDTLIRERSRNKRSLDDFARAFFGMNDGDWGQLTYTFDDVVNTLNSVEPFDWATLLRARLEESAGSAPLDGIARGGYRLVYGEAQSDYQRAVEARRKVVDLSLSLGIVVDAKGKITNVGWESPAFRANLTPGLDLIAVNNIAFDGDRLRAAVKATKDGAPIELLIRDVDEYRSVRIDYKGGLRYPKLERIPNTPALLDAILAPKK